MIYYIFPYILIVLMSALSLKIRGNGYKFLLFIALIPATLLVVLRGLVGTDTENYISILDQDIYGINENEIGIEPFFLLFARVRYFFDLDSQLVLNLFSFLTISLLYLFFSKTKHRSIVFCSLIFPTFFYDMTMNGLRYGMAFALACYVIVENEKKLLKITRNKLIFIFSILNHKSSILFLIIKFLQKVSFKNFIFIIITAFISFLSLKEYLIYKISDYSDLSSPSIFSGIQPLLISVLVLFCNSYFYKKNLKRNLYLLVIQFFFYVITQFSYAGIRFQFLELFYILVILTEDEIIEKYKTYVFWLFFIGFIGFCLRLNNFYSTAGQGNSPFLPYIFFWEN